MNSITHKFSTYVKYQFNSVKRYKMNSLNLPTNLRIITLNEQTNYRLNEINKIKD